MLTRSTFIYRQVVGMTQFDVDEFDIDPILNKLFILDYSEGLISVSLSHLKKYTKI